MKEFIINIGPLETRIAILEDKRLAELHIEREESRSIVGNVYKGRVDSIVPGIQAAFIDIGFEKNGFLYVSDIAGTEGTGDFVIEDGIAQARTRGRHKSLSIENILKKNQYIMVQVSKDRLGTKGVRLTNFITFPGRYVVLMPTVTQLGVSRKIEDDKERDRLKKLLQALRPKGVGLITRTAGEGAKKADLQNDIKYLSKLWDRVKSKMETTHGPGLLYEDLGPVLRIVRDTFTSEAERLVVDNESEFARIQYFLDMYAPNLKKRCELYKGPRPIFEQYEVEPEIEKALRRKVLLKSGGHICIDQTEALVAIDVNTGKFTGKGRLEETVFKTNIEAAGEIARQVRLRDMGGIIVVDFIDMEQERNRRELLRVLREALKSDRAKTTASEVTELGMIEMTRKRTKESIGRLLCEACFYCEGEGHLKSKQTVCYEILRELERERSEHFGRNLLVMVHPDVAGRFYDEERGPLERVEERLQARIMIKGVAGLHLEQYEITPSDA